MFFYALVSVQTLEFAGKIMRFAARLHALIENAVVLSRGTAMNGDWNTLKDECRLTCAGCQ